MLSFVVVVTYWASCLSSFSYRARFEWFFSSNLFLVVFSNAACISVDKVKAVPLSSYLHSHKNTLYRADIVLSSSIALFNIVTCLFKWFNSGFLLLISFNFANELMQTSLDCALCSIRITAFLSSYDATGLAMLQFNNLILIIIIHWIVFCFFLFVAFPYVHFDFKWMPFIWLRFRIFNSNQFCAFSHRALEPVFARTEKRFFILCANGDYKSTFFLLRFILNFSF